MLGEGAVGKTSLAYRLIEDKYVVKDRTHGMNVWPLELPLPPDATLDREALLWDLAGQEDYRLIHRLFLDETALALLLINPQKDDPFAEAGDWLKALDTAASNQAAKREAATAADLLADRRRRHEDQQRQDRTVRPGARLRRLAGHQRQDRRELLGRGERGTALQAEAAHR